MSRSIRIPYGTVPLARFKRTETPYWYSFGMSKSSVATAKAPASPYAAPGPYRDFLFPLIALFAGLAFPASWLIYTFLVIGQSHFWMTYIYQYRGGKIGRRYLLSVALLASATLAYLWFFGEQGFWIFLVVALLFPIHFAFDEFVLHRERSTPRTLTTVAGFTLLSFLIVLSEAVKDDWCTYLLYGVSAIFFCGAAWRFYSNRDSVLKAERYLWYVGAALLVLYLCGRPEQALSVIILLHGLNWALAFGERVKGDARKAREYWLLTAVTVTVSLAAFIVFLALKTEYLRYFFAIVYYDAWAIAHIVLSVRIPLRTRV